MDTFAPYIEASLTLWNNALREPVPKIHPWPVVMSLSLVTETIRPRMQERWWRHFYLDLLDSNACSTLVGRDRQISVPPDTVKRLAFNCSSVLPMISHDDQCGSHTSSQCVQLPFFFLHTEVTLNLLRHQSLFLGGTLAQLTHTRLHHHWWLAAGLAMSDLTLHPNFSAAVSLNGKKDDILLPGFPTGM